MDSFGRRRAAEGRLVSRSEALTQAVAERAVDLVVSALDVNALLDEVDLNALLDRIDLNAVLGRIDVDTLVEKTDLGAIIVKSSGGVASEAIDAVRSHVVELDEFIARWIGRLRRRPYTGPPGPPEPPGALRGKAGS